MAKHLTYLIENHEGIKYKKTIFNLIYIKYHDVIKRWEVRILRFFDYINLIFIHEIRNSSVDSIINNINKKVKILAF